MDKRSANGFHHLGDLAFRLRSQNSTHWTDYDTSADRKPITPIPAKQDTIAAADLAPTLPSGLPLQVVRSWIIDKGDLVLRFDLKNRTDNKIEIGSLAIPVIFNNILTDRSLAEVHERCSFSDPYIGLDAGYLQVTRLNGKGPTLIVVPERNTFHSIPSSVICQPFPIWDMTGTLDATGIFFMQESFGGSNDSLHHYGSGLNAIPVLAHYRQHPDDFYLLRVGYGGTMGALSKHRSGRFCVGSISLFSIHIELGSVFRRLRSKLFRTRP